MNTPFNFSQWLKQQEPVTPPTDDFAFIYQQIKAPKAGHKHIIPWALAATFTLLIISLVMFKPTLNSTDIPAGNSQLAQLKQHIHALEQNLQSDATAPVSQPGSAQLENQVQLEQWLAIINAKLEQKHNPHQQQQLMQAKRSVLQRLAPINQSIELI
mgnify:CR=1 FL=1